MQPNVKLFIIKIEVDNTVITDPTEIAKKLMIFSHMLLVTSLVTYRLQPQVFYRTRIGRFHDTFAFFGTAAQENSRIITYFKIKKCSINEVPRFSYKFEAEELSPIFATLNNESIRLSILPNCFKIARVTSIHKVSNEKCVRNYRPISSLPLLSKVFEKLVHSRLYSFFDKLAFFINKNMVF